MGINLLSYYLQVGVVRNNKFYVYVDRRNISSLLQDLNSTYSDENVDIYQTEDNSITCAMPVIGFGITISSAEGAISFVLQVPATWQGHTTGLLGNYNGNKSDDFVPRGSKAAISDGESDRNIHFHFAQTCKTKSALNLNQFILIVHISGFASQTESMFSYYDNTSWQFYSHPTHVPVFADEIFPTDVQKSVCGNDIQCIYDLSQTNSTSFAMETARFGDINIQNAKIISTFIIIMQLAN